MEKKEIIKKIINSILIIISILGVITSIYMLIVKRDLWLDEAMFSYSLIKRGLLNLTVGAFEKNQFAPIVYIYIVKIITKIFGTGEIALRIWSLISYVGILIVSFIICKKVYKMKYPLLCVAFLANMPFVLKYSNEFKVYIFDGLVCLITIFTYYNYLQKKINLKQLLFIFIIAMISSNPACFIIASILITEFLHSLYEKDYKHLKKITIVAIAVLACFIMYYFYWLKDVANSNVMLSYWENYNFPLIPKSMDDLARMNELTISLLRRLGNYNVIIIFLAIISVVVGVIKKDKVKTVVLLTFILAFVASYIKKFPVADRMWFFIYPIIVIYAFETLNNLFSKNVVNNITILVISFILIISNNGIGYYLVKDNIYMKGDEASSNIRYVEENLKEDEKAYLFYLAVPQYEYYAKDLSNNQIIFGEHSEKTQIEVNKIKDINKLYIITSRYFENKSESIVELGKYGYIELIKNPYNTALYYYVKNPEDLKTKVEYKIGNVEKDEEKYNVTIEIKNIGESIINNNVENVYLMSKDNKKIKQSIPKLLEKDESATVKLDIDFKQQKEIEVQLYSNSANRNYWYDELKIEPLKINKNVLEGIMINN